MNENNYPSPNEGQRILVVDDAADTRLILNLRLQRARVTLSTRLRGAVRHWKLSVVKDCRTSFCSTL